jgi:hypothetical protein
MEENPTGNPNEVFVYDKFKLGRVEGKFSRDMKKLVLEGIPMRRFEADNYNRDTHESGVMFVYNEEKTAKYKEYEQTRKEKVIAAKEKKTIDAKALINSVFDTLLKEKLAAGADTEDGLTVKEMKTKCEELGYPKKEWQSLNKADLTEYLKTKTEGQE